MSAQSRPSQRPQARGVEISAATPGNGNPTIHLSKIDNQKPRPEMAGAFSLRAMRRPRSWAGAWDHLPSGACDSVGLAVRAIAAVSDTSSFSEATQICRAPCSVGIGASMPGGAGA